MKVSLIIPCYNEARNLPALVERCRVVTRDPDFEVVLVDNGSTDDTPAVLASLLDGVEGCRAVRVVENQGYGFGILSGLRAASGDVLAWTHADQQTDPADVIAAFEKFRASSEPERLFVKGRREGRPLQDVVFTAGMSAFETLLTGRVMRDINAQPTMFHRTFFESWASPPSDFALDLYAFWRAREAGLKVERFPVRFGKRVYGTSNWNTGIAGRMKFIRRTLDFSIRLKRGQA
jgi:glycosyltransferase involved in cell wall biosynthesis